MKITPHVNGSMACPYCGESYTHVNDVIVAGRFREDGQIVYTRIGPDGQVMSQSPEGSAPEGRLGEGRRHRIALLGYCETCSGRQFAIVFTQHKGETFIDVVPYGPDPALDPYRANIAG